VRSALRGELIKAYGTTGRFDYIFASDVAEGLLRLSEVGLEGPVNLGFGRSRTVSEALSILHDHVPGIAVDHEISDGLTEASEADLSLLRSATNWQPETTLEEGLRRIIEFESRAHAVSDTAGG
jgi:nucleoside-diphosphate-sugar epimerase